MTPERFEAVLGPGNWSTMEEVALDLNLGSHTSWCRSSHQNIVVGSDLASSVGTKLGNAWWNRELAQKACGYYHPRARQELNLHFYFVKKK